MEMLILIVVLDAIVCSLLGALVGGRKGADVAGGLLGLLFGPLGVIVAFALDERPRCLHCRERVQKNASLCSHCRSPIYWNNGQQFPSQEAYREVLAQDRMLVEQRRAKEAKQMAEWEAEAQRRGELWKQRFAVASAAVTRQSKASWAWLAPKVLWPFQKIDSAIWTVSGEERITYGVFVGLLLLALIGAPVGIALVQSKGLADATEVTPQAASLTPATAEPESMATDRTVDDGPQVIPDGVTIIGVPEELHVAAAVVPVPQADVADIPARPEPGSVVVPVTLAAPAQPEWQTLIPASPPMLHVTSIPNLAFRCPQEGFDRKLRDWYAVNGHWQPSPGGISSVGERAALKVGNAVNFSVEGDVSLSKHGGWYWLIGWTGTGGYMVYDAGLSSTTWFLNRVSDNPAECKQLHRFSRKFIMGQNPVAISVQDAHLSFSVGPLKFLENFHLPDYKGGEIITGTFSPSAQYNSRQVEIHSLRIRSSD